MLNIPLDSRILLPGGKNQTKFLKLHSSTKGVLTVNLTIQCY